MEVTTNTQRKGLPRSLQFQRMERIVKAMQHPTAGVPVRSQKLFLTTVPNAFTGNDITEWIMQKLNVKDSGLLNILFFLFKKKNFFLAEALHLASLLCYFGYFFHVTTNGAVQIKEDNELFRFQAPYFWVSTNWTTGNTEYG
jgi:regulator of G-protein signaling